MIAQAISGLTATQIHGATWAMGITAALLIVHEVIADARRRATQRAIQRHIDEARRLGKPLHPCLRNRDAQGVES